MLSPLDNVKFVVGNQAYVKEPAPVLDAVKVAEPPEQALPSVTVTVGLG